MVICEFAVSKLENLLQNKTTEHMPFRPLLLAQTANKPIALTEEHPPQKIGKVNLDKPEKMQLPIEQVFPFFGGPEVYDQQACVFYLQEIITEPATESEIK